MTTTAYIDTFNRTVTGGLGTADTGQGPYALSATASQFSVAPSTATITPNAIGSWFGIVNRFATNFDLSGRAALSAIPATNLATVGFMAMGSSDTLNGFVGTLMVATGGAMSLRISKIVAGGLVTLTTLALGTTYVANTFYNLRFQGYWSVPLQTNVLNLKIWAVGATQPGGWNVSFQDASFTNYTAGSYVGPYARNEASTVTGVSGLLQNFAAASYALPMPSSTDAMCADPAVTYPKQTAAQSLAVAADTAMASIDPLTILAGLFPRVRVSLSNTAFTSSQNPVWQATEFNIGTSTNLGYNPGGLYLPTGIWLVTFEVRLVESASAVFTVGLSASPNSIFAGMRQNPVLLNDQGVGGCAHISALATSTDPVLPAFVSANWAFPATYTVAYAALSAIKISDYF